MDGKIILKTPNEIQKMRDGGKIHREILQSLKKFSVAGKTTHEVDERARELCRKFKVIPSFLNYGGFPGAACVSINNEIVHTPPSEKILRDGDIFSIDFGVYFENFHTDGCITFGIGKISQTAQNLIFTAEKALTAAIELCRDGEKLQNVGAVIEKITTKNNFSVVRNLTGHGIGREIHEAPRVFNFREKSDDVILRAGMTIAIEPIICENSSANFTAADGFAILTKDGGLSSHCEHTVLIRENDAEILT